METTSEDIVLPTPTHRKRRDIREAYMRVLPKTWGETPDSTDPKLIRSAIKGVWRKLRGKPCSYTLVITKRGGFRTEYVPSTCKLCAGNRAWAARFGAATVQCPLCKGKGRKGHWVAYFNPNHGLHQTIHELTHWLHWKIHPSDKPHNARHLEMERTAAEYVVKRFFS